MGITEAELLDIWYNEDTNAVPSVFILQPISSILLNFGNRVSDAANKLIINIVLQPTIYNHLLSPLYHPLQPIFTPFTLCLASSLTSRFCTTLLLCESPGCFPLLCYVWSLSRSLLLRLTQFEALSLDSIAKYDL